MTPLTPFFFPESHSRMHNEHTKPFPKVASKKTHVRLSPRFIKHFQLVASGLFGCTHTTRQSITRSFHLFICGPGCNLAFWSSIHRERERGERKKRQRKHLYDRIGTHTVSSNLGTPLPPSPAPSVCMCVWVPVSMHVCELPPRPPPPPCLSRLLHAALRRLEKVVVVSLKYHFNYGV